MRVAPNLLLPCARGGADRPRLAAPGLEDVEQRVGSRQRERGERGEHPGDDPPVALAIRATKSLAEARHVAAGLHQVSAGLTADGARIFLTHGSLLLQTVRVFRAAPGCQQRTENAPPAHVVVIR